MQEDSCKWNDEEEEEEERTSGSISGIYRHITIELEGAIFGSLPL
jgi:hypothetical protein